MSARVYHLKEFLPVVLPARKPLSEVVCGGRSGRGGDDGAGIPVRDAPPRRPSALPCLPSNNSMMEGNEAGKIADCNILRGNHKKSAKVLELSVRRMIKKHGIDRVGFQTLTFSDHLTDAREAGRRLNSLLTNEIRPRYANEKGETDYVCVLERQKNGRVHYHLIIALPVDVRTGFNHAQVDERNYGSVCPWLLKEWGHWRRTLPRYKFGRASLVPVKSTEDAVSFYLSKYISKHIEAREERDKGVRLVRISYGAKAGTTRFNWGTLGNRLWREKVGAIGKSFGIAEADISKAFGRSWMYKHQDLIQAVKIKTYWSEEAMEADTTPPGLTQIEKVLDHLFETGGEYRISPEKAGILIGNRNEQGRHSFMSQRDYHRNRSRIGRQLLLNSRSLFLPDDTPTPSTTEQICLSFDDGMQLSRTETPIDGASEKG